MGINTNFGGCMAKKKKKIVRDGVLVPRNHGLPWTVEDMWDLVTLWDSPRTVESIAREIGRSEGACHAKVYVVRLAYEMAKDMTPKKAETMMKNLANAPGRTIPHRQAA